MTTLAITRRPVVLETRASAAMLTDILGRIATIDARMSPFGVTDPLRAALLASTSREAWFDRSEYRTGYVMTGAPSTLPGWTFARASTGVAVSNEGVILPFATGVPRITDRGLLVEPAGTNLLIYSQALDNAEWDKTAYPTTVSLSATPAPDGTSTAWDVLDTTANSIHGLARGIVPPVAGAHTLSIYVRPGTQTSILMREEFSVGGNVVFDLTARTATVTAPAVSGRVTAMTNGWLRCEATWTLPVAFCAFVIATPTAYVGAGSTIYTMWGGQIEAHSRARSYVATTTAAVTRAADAPAFTLPSHEEGAILVEATGTGTALSADAGTGTVEYLAINGSGAALFQDTVNFYSPTRVGHTGARFKAVVAWSRTQVFTTFDGVELASGSLPRPIHLSICRPGTTFYGGDQLGNYVHRIVVLDHLPTLAERIAMTS